MMVLNAEERTPCGALFEVLKRSGGISHKELASLILSNRPLSDGRSPASRANDRTWLSRFVVHAPVGSLQPLYFRDFGMAAQGVMARLKSRHGKALSNESIVSMVCGESGQMLERALAEQRQDTTLYRNALERLAKGQGYSAGERAEAVLVLFIAAGCTANVRQAVGYALDYARAVHGGLTTTPMAAGSFASSVQVAQGPRRLGLMRIADGYVVGGVHWVAPELGGIEIGSLVTGENDVVEVELDVSAQHARIWHDGERWMVRDLGSSNGTWVVDGASGEECRLGPEDSREIQPGDELRLGSATVFVLVEGAIS